MRFAGFLRQSRLVGGDIWGTVQDRGSPFALLFAHRWLVGESMCRIWDEGVCNHGIRSHLEGRVYAYQGTHLALGVALIPPTVESCEEDPFL
jgi:hypothetical protein